MNDMDLFSFGHISRLSLPLMLLKDYVVMWPAGSKHCVAVGRGVTQENGRKTEKWLTWLMVGSHGSPVHRPKYH